MPRTSSWRGSGLLLVWTLLLCAPVAGAELAGRIVSVHDGDTATLLDAHQQQYKIRLAGIDAPELHQAYGRVSQQHLSAAIRGKEVVVRWTKHDKYGRMIGTILLNRQDINLDQLKAGLAWHYKRYAREQPAAERTSYAQAEMQAQSAHRGLWQEDRPVPPWDYRKAGHRDSSLHP